MKQAGELPQEAVLTLRHWGNAGDKSRVYEAIWVGAQLKQQGIRHAHTHFAGIGARTLFWIKRFYRIGYSFTGHANDIFERNDFALGLEDLMREAACVATVSDYTAGFLHECFPESKSKTRRVYNGLDMAPFSRIKNEPADPPLILSVGRLIEKKGYPDLIAACGRLKTQGHSFQCRIVGDGPMEEELQA